MAHHRFEAGSVLVLAAALALSPAPAAAAKTLVVTQSSVAYPHYATIQSAVAAAEPGDWVLIDVGVYAGTVLVTTPRVHLRGVDRNNVILDGQHQVGNGIEVSWADGVSIENLTVRDFDRPGVDGEDGNEIWWNGGDGTGVIGMHGWKGRYLTTYDTGLNGGYGIFISNAENGSLDQAYASGFNDSGIYLGACRDCKAKLSHMLVENNALGYSGTNSGGHIQIRDSIFQHNSNGVGPNSLNNDDQPPPQDGACDSGLNDSATPVFTSTRIRRCTIIKHNQVLNNDNFTTPANSTTASIPWGNGIVLIGTYADKVEHNVISGNPSAGLLGLENPDPFPATPETVFFQLSGNMVVSNTFTNNGTNPNAHAADITLLGGLFGDSTNNCFSHNILTDTFPADLQTGWSCKFKTTPNPGIGALNYVLGLQAASQARTSVPQPAPGPQPTMKSPCAGVPRNPLCG